MKAFVSKRFISIFVAPTLLYGLVLPSAAMAAGDNSANLTSVSVTGGVFDATPSGGKTQIGAVLTANAVGKTVATTTTTYEWKFGSTVVSTTNSYTIQPGDLGKDLRVTIRVSNATSNNTRTSPPITVYPANSAPGITSATIEVGGANSPAVVPVGTPEAYTVLTATANGVTGFPITASSYSYEWKVGDDVVGDNRMSTPLGTRTLVRLLPSPSL